MKKVISFIPLGIGISGAFLYLYNLVSFRVINNGATLGAILSNIRIYLYIAIIGFMGYFVIKALEYFKSIKKESIIKEQSVEKEDLIIKEEQPLESKIIYKDESTCINCGTLIDEEDMYCKTCGSNQKENKNTKKVLRKLIDIIETIILLLVIFFALFMIFDYKEKSDSSFTSPFKFSLTK